MINWLFYICIYDKQRPCVAVDKGQCFQDREKVFYSKTIFNKAVKWYIKKVLPFLD